MSANTKCLYRISQWGMLAIMIVFHGVATAQQDLQSVARTLVGQISERGKHSAAVVDFTDSRDTPTECGRYLAEELSVALAVQAKAFMVVDRAHLKAIIQEHRLSSAGLISPETARKLGQIAGVDVLVTGTMVPFSDSIRLSVKALDTSTAQILGATMYDLPRTKAIIDMNCGALASAALPEPPKLPPTSAGMRVTEGDLAFIVKSCRRSGENLSCFGSITNTYSSARRLVLYSSQLIDDQGVEYEWRQTRIGNSGYDVLLQSNLTVNFTYDARGASPAARTVTLILKYVVSEADGREHGRNATGLMLRNIPVTSQ